MAVDGITSTGTVTRGRSITATMTFDGSGNYTETGQLSDSTVSSGAPQALSITNGTYAVSASGLLILSSPLTSGDYLYGGVGASAVVASSTEGNVLDMLVAVPVGAAVSNASLSGQYRVGAIEYPNGDITLSKNALFTINADGTGNLGAVTLSGHSAALLNTDTSQTVSAATYSLSGTTGTLTFPAGSAGTNQLLSGTKQFFVSSDGKVLVGGALNGYDMIVGIAAFQGTAGNANLSGTYFTAGTDSDLSNAKDNSFYVDGYYGSLNGNAAGTLIAHQRVNPSNSPPYDYTADDNFDIGPDGQVTETYEQFYIGAGGGAAVLTGRSTVYSLELAIAPLTVATSGSVVLNPVGVVNTANFAPITNPIAPGEMISLFGTGLAPSAQTASLPFNTSLNGVSVSVGGLPASVFYVSPGEIICVVPFGLTASFAPVQVTNNGTLSNTVTLFSEQSAPGVFTTTQNGVGPGAFLHPNGTVVSDSSPANVNETIAGYLTGLGTVTPAVSDGAPAPAKPLSATDDQIVVYVDGQPSTVSFAGLAPGFVGLYQVNFTIPATPDTGNVYVDFEDSDFGGYTSMALINVSGSQATAASTAAVRAGRPSRNHKAFTHGRPLTRTSGANRSRVLPYAIKRSGS